MGLLAGMLLGGGILLGGPSAKAEPVKATLVLDDSTAADTTNQPSQEPYATDRSLWYHVLATPAYVFRGLVFPLGWAGRYLERNAQRLFEGDLPPRFVLPLVEIGGPTDFQAGVLAYDNQLFGTDHSARLRALYGGPNTFRTQLTYNSPSLFQFQANVFSNPESGFFLDGNDADKEEDDASADLDQVDVTAGVQGAPIEGLNTSFDLTYEHVETKGGDDEEGELLESVNPAGLGTVDLMTSRVAFKFGRIVNEKHASRPYLGTDAILQLGYTHDLTGDRFRYGRYVVDVRQHLPIAILPKSRRLVLKGHLEQVEPLFGGSDVPFFQRPTLGGQRTLRGFSSSRFQEDGALAGSVEYRYPIWRNLDAVALVDVGQVFDSFEDVAVDRFHWSYGGGLHLISGGTLRFRFELAHSPEGLRTILTVSPSFQRSAR